MPRKNNIWRIGSPFGVSVLLFIGIIALYIALFFIFDPAPSPSTLIHPQEAQSTAVLDSKGGAPKTPFKNFVYIDSCQRYVLRDLQDINVFEQYHADIKPAYIAQILRAGRTLSTFLKTLKNDDNPRLYRIVLIGSLADEWLPNFERENTWAYRTSYDRALSIYKLWLKNEIDIRSYGVEISIQGIGYHPFCHTDAQKNKSLSVQLHVSL